MPAVNSRAISFIDYDEASQQMNVTFRETGRTYTFCRVPSHVYDAFLNAPSIGGFFNDHIRDNYDC